MQAFPRRVIQMKPVRHQAAAPGDRQPQAARDPKKAAAYFAREAIRGSFSSRGTLRSGRPWLCACEAGERACASDPVNLPDLKTDAKLIAFPSEPSASETSASNRINLTIEHWHKLGALLRPS